jgi:hypothetical protein
MQKNVQNVDACPWCLLPDKIGMSVLGMREEEEEKRKWSMRRWQRTFNGLYKPNTLNFSHSRQIQPSPHSFPSFPFHPSTMSDKTTGYRLEYSSSNRAKCKGLNIFLCIRLRLQMLIVVCLFKLMVGLCSNNRTETMLRYVALPPSSVRFFAHPVL